jgi:hypothetical protein
MSAARSSGSGSIWWLNSALGIVRTEEGAHLQEAHGADDRVAVTWTALGHGQGGELAQSVQVGRQ